MKTRVLFIGLIFIISLSSCATIISGTKQKVSIESTPSNATVFLNKKEVGKTPFKTKLRRTKDYELMICFDGYYDYEMLLTRKLNNVTFVNFIHGGIVGLILDLSTGSLHRFTKPKIHVELIPNRSPLKRF